MRAGFWILLMLASASCQRLPSSNPCALSPADDEGVLLRCEDGREVHLSPTPTSPTSASPASEGPSLDALRGRLALVEGELEQVRASSRVAGETLAFIERGDLVGAVAYHDLHREALINDAEASLLSTRVDTVRRELASSAYREGIERFLADEMAAARVAFERSLVHQPSGPYSPLIHHHLGLVLFRLDDHNGAREHLSAALEGPLPVRHEIEARYHLGRAVEALGRFHEAHTIYQAFMRELHYNDHSPDVLRRITRIAREYPLPVGGD